MTEELSPRRRRLTLAATCVAQAMILLDMTIVNVALPSIQEELGVTPGNLEWIVNAYVLAYLSFAGTFFFVTLYFQNARGWSALATGLSWIPLNLPFLAASVNAGRIGRRLGTSLVCGAAPSSPPPGR